MSRNGNGLTHDLTTALGHHDQIRQPGKKLHHGKVVNAYDFTIAPIGLAGAVVQQGMTVMAYNGAVLVRICQQKMTKRTQRFRRLLGLKSPKIKKISHIKT